MCDCGGGGGGGLGEEKGRGEAVRYVNRCRIVLIPMDGYAFFLCLALLRVEPAGVVSVS